MLEEESNDVPVGMAEHSFCSLLSVRSGPWFVFKLMITVFCHTYWHIITLLLQHAIMNYL